MQKTFAVFMSVMLVSSCAWAVDLSKVPQIHETKEQRDARMQWFRDAKFGMFIHWGPCSVGRKKSAGAATPTALGHQRRADPAHEDPVYDNYFKRSTRSKYDADAWVRLAQEAGMKYMVLIAKHHDGFAQFDSKLTDYDIMSTPYGKDIVRQLRRRLPQARHETRAVLFHTGLV